MMGIRNKLIICILPLLLGVAQTSASKCNCEGYFCVSDTEYQLCQNGEVIEVPIPCDEGITCRNEHVGCSLQPLCRKSSPAEENSSGNVGSVCQGEGHYPDPENCQRFYMCTGYGVGKVMSCPTGTYYNDRTYICSGEVPERCALTDQTDVPSGNDNSFDCPGVGLFADAENCRRYYQCDEYQRSFLKDCAEGTYFDEEVEECVSSIPERCRGSEQPGIETTTDQLSTTQTSPTEQDITTVYPTDAAESTTQTTDNGQVTEQTTDNAGVTNTQTEITDGSTTTTTTSPPRDGGSFVCPGEGYYPDPEDCQRYYVCDVVDRPMRVSCPEGTYYMEEFEFCSKDIPERCNGLDTTVYPTDTAESTTQTTDNGQVTEQTTDNAGVTNTQTEITDGSTTTTTTSPPRDGGSFVCPGEGYYPDPEDCQRYYVCDVVDRPMRVSCPEGTYYVEEFEFCSKDIPERCYGLGNPPVTSTAKNDEYTTTERLSTRDPTEGQTSTNAPRDFVCTDEGFFPDPENCQRYYICIGLEEVLTFSCPNDTYYDEEKTFCTSEMPERCRESGKSTEQPTTANTGTTETTTEGSKTTEGTPKGDFECPGEGYYADPTNCQNYYVCFNSGDEYISIPVVCPENTYFDEESEFCTADIPERCSAQTGGSTTTSPKNDEDFSCPGEGYYPDPNNCNLYYMCYGDFAIPLACPNGTYFDDSTDFCTEQMPERCRASDDDADRTTTPSYTDRPTTEKNTNGFECPGDGYYPDPDNCQYYYICYNGGTGIPVSCPDNTYFDTESTFCTKDMPKRCRSTEKPPENEVTSTTPSAPAEDEFTCPGEGYYPNPKDCQSYYICYGGNRFITLSCPEDTFYDIDSSFCTANMPDRCRATETPNQDDTYETTTPTSDMITTPAPEQDVFKCPAEGYYPDPKDCHRYYVCYGFGSPLRLTCPDDTYFDESGFCTLDRPERCTPDKPQYTPKPPQDTEREFKCSSPGEFPDPKDCQKYWICYSNNFGYPVQCPNGTYYHEDSTYCTNYKPQRCKGPGDEDFQCPGEGYFADPVDCHKYHVCYTRSVSIPMRCPGNSYYHQSIEGCAPDVPDTCRNPDGGEKFVCPRAGSFPDPRDCSRYYVCNFWGDSFLMKCPRGRYFNENIRACSSQIPPRCQSLTPPLQNGFMCSNAGYFADPVNCSVYHICNMFGRYYTASCPPKMYYHEDTRTCSPIIPDRCIYLGSRKSALGPVEDLQETPVLSDTGDALNNTFVCPDNGLFPDPYDCHKFYVCYGQPRQVTCWGKTYYDEETQKCVENMPERCKAVDGDTTTQAPGAPSTTPQPEEFVCPENGLIPDPYDCQKFYVCYGQPRHVTCRDGMYFDEETRQCNKEMPERCTNGDGNVTPQPTPPPTTGEFVCPGKGLFPHPSSCHKFFVCYGEPREVTCWGGNYYDEESQGCVEDMPDRCKGDDDDVSPPPTSPPSAQPGEFECPGTGLYPDPSDCHSFYVCYGQPKKVTCRDRMYYNEETKECGDEIPERCKNNNDNQVTQPPATPPTQPGEFVCPGTGLFPHPTNCHKFFVCYGEPREVTCWGDNYYDEESQNCVEDMPDRCKGDGDDNVTPGPTASPTSQPGEFICPGTGLFPDPDDCRKFYVCYGQTRHVTCREGSYFNVETQECDEEMPERCKTVEDQTSTSAPSTTTTTEMPTTPKESFECQNPGRYPDPLDCQSFYFCNYRREAFHFTCKDSNYFNDITKECQPQVPDRCRSDDDRDSTTTSRPPSTVVCREAGRYPDPENCLHYYFCSDADSVPIRFTCPTNQFFNAAKGKCKKIKTGFECPTGNSDRYHSGERDSDEDDDNDDDDFVCTQPGLYPDVRDCKKFYECTLSLKMNHKTCSGKTYFNERFRYCSIFTTERCKMYGIFW